MRLLRYPRPRRQRPHPRLALAILLVAVPLAGCTGDDGDPTYGHILMVEAAGTGSCTLLTPYPLVDGEVWDALEILNASNVSARVVTSEKGPAFEVGGVGNFSVAARTKTEVPLDQVELSLREVEWRSFSGGVGAVFNVSAEGCANGTSVTVTWLRDIKQAIEGVRINGEIKRDGWHPMAGVRTLTE